MPLSQAGSNSNAGSHRPKSSLTRILCKRSICACDAAIARDKRLEPKSFNVFGVGSVGRWNVVDLAYRLCQTLPMMARKTSRTAALARVANGSSRTSGASSAPKSAAKIAKAAANGVQKAATPAVAAAGKPAKTNPPTKRVRESNRTSSTGPRRPAQRKRGPAARPATRKTKSINRRRRRGTSSTGPRK